MLTTETAREYFNRARDQVLYRPGLSEALVVWPSSRAIGQSIVGAPPYKPEEMQTVMVGDLTRVLGELYNGWMTSRDDGTEFQQFLFNLKTGNLKPGFDKWSVGGLDLVAHTFNMEAVGISVGTSIRLVDPLSTGYSRFKNTGNERRREGLAGENRRVVGSLSRGWLGGGYI